MSVVCGLRLRRGGGAPKRGMCAADILSAACRARGLASAGSIYGSKASRHSATLNTGTTSSTGVAGQAVRARVAAKQLLYPETTRDSRRPGAKVQLVPQGRREATAWPMEHKSADAMSSTRRRTGGVVVVAAVCERSASKALAASSSSFRRRKTPRRATDNSLRGLFYF